MTILVKYFFIILWWQHYIYMIIALYKWCILELFYTVPVVMIVGICSLKYKPIQILYFRAILTTASSNDNRNRLTKIQNYTNIEF